MIVWIIRHGKAERHPPSPSGADFDRPLRARGERQAAWLGEQLAARDDAPLRLISSRAVRARQTAELVSETLGGEPPGQVEFDDRLLVDEPAGPLIDLLSELAAGEPPAVALFGHNPTLSILASTLSGQHIALRTGEAAAIEFTGPIEPGAGVLLDLLRLDD